MACGVLIEGVGILYKERISIQKQQKKRIEKKKKVEKKQNKKKNLGDVSSVIAIAAGVVVSITDMSTHGDVVVEVVTI